MKFPESRFGKDQTACAFISMSTRHNVPISVLADSYKASHFKMYPEVTKMIAYGEFRKSFQGDKNDNRFIFYGIRNFIETYLHYQWTMEDVEEADKFYATHNAYFTPYPFPRHLFEKFIKENDGYFPIRVEALEEGTVAHVHVPVYQITADDEYATLITFFETIMTQVWYPTCVATLSRRAKDYIQVGFEKSVDAEQFGLLDTKLHDFGFRGCTCVEQAIIGGCAHMLNFIGSDTMAAAYHAQYHLNNGKPVCQSVPATEHSVMTSWKNERMAMMNMIEQFGGGVISVVMDSYDYTNALNKIIPEIMPEFRKKGGLFVMRPDSGDPVEAVMEALIAGDKAFGSKVNGKGFKVLDGANVLQGDGINIVMLQKIMDAVLEAGYSAQNVTFGMGGGLMQKVDRDTMSFATKLSYSKQKDGTERDIMKKPKTDPTKFSLPGYLKVLRVDGIPTVFPRGLNEEVPESDNLLKVMYDKRPNGFKFATFDEMRTKVATEWAAAPKLYDPISKEMHAKIADWIANFDSHWNQN